MKKLLVFLLFTFSLACLGQSVSVKHSTIKLGSNQTQVEVLILPTAIAQVSEVCLNFRAISYVLLSLDSVVTKFNGGIELYVYDLSNHNINQWAEFNYSWAATSTGTQMMDTIKIYFKAWNQGTTPLKWQNSSISNTTGQINCTFLDGLINVPPLTRVRGAVFYSSDQVTVVPGSTITAWGQWQKHYHSWTTNAYGYYEIDLPRDCYNISVSGPGDMGAVNTSDALAVMRDFAGVQSLPQNRKVAGDVNASGSLNTTDALYIAKYFVGHPIFSPAWFTHFDQVLVVNDYPFWQNFDVVLIGDANGSWGNPLKSSLALEKRSEMKVNGNQFSIPMRIDNFSKLHSISLSIDIGPGVYIEGIDINADSETLFYSVNNSQLKISWFSLEPLMLNQGDILLSINLKASKPEDIDLKLLDNCELTDFEGNPIKALLYVPDLKTSEIQVFPNPTADLVNINHQTPGSFLKIYDAFGRLVDSIELTQNSTTYDMSHLAFGVYTFLISSDQYRYSQRVIYQ